jgi:hypothetical protein
LLRCKSLEALCNRCLLLDLHCAFAAGVALQVALGRLALPLAHQVPPHLLSGPLCFSSRATTIWCEPPSSESN